MLVVGPGKLQSRSHGGIWTKKMKAFSFLSASLFLDFDFVVDFNAIDRHSQDLVYMATSHKIIIVLQFKDHGNLTIAGHKTYPVYLTTTSTFNQELHPNL